MHAEVLPGADRINALLRRMNEQLDEYFALGQAEGRENRAHDTADGAAQRTLSAIRRTVSEIRRAEREDCAALLTLSSQDLLLHLGEMSAPQLRAAQAVLRNRKDTMLASGVPAAPEDEPDAGDAGPGMPEHSVRLSDEDIALLVRRMGEHAEKRDAEHRAFLASPVFAEIRDSILGASGPEGFGEEEALYLFDGLKQRLGWKTATRDDALMFLQALGQPEADDVEPGSRHVDPALHFENVTFRRHSLTIFQMYGQGTSTYVGNGKQEEPEEL